MYVSKKIVPMTMAAVLGCTSSLVLIPEADAAKASQVAAGAPEWVTRGGGAYQGDSSKSFYGVGIANGIKNAALLRQTADNRARADLASVFEVYVAALSKSYQASTNNNGNINENQTVENAMMTYTQKALQGSEIIDRYIDGQGNMYSLAVLNLDRAKEVAAAIEQGAVKTYDVAAQDSAFDELSQMMKPATTTPVTATKDTPAPELSASSTNKKEKKEKCQKQAKVTKSKGRPDWVDGPSAVYPNAAYLCGVGIGNDRSISENGAFAAISKVFNTKVEAVSKDYQSSLTRTGEKGIEVQAVASSATVSTNALLRGVQVREYYQEKKKAPVYTLACLERAPAAIELRDMITQLDEKADNAFQKAEESSDNLQKVKQLSVCLKTIIDRSFKNSLLRIIDADGIGVAPALSYVDVEDALGEAVQQFNIGINVDGDEGADDVKQALLEGLNGKNYQVLDPETASDADAPNGLDLIVTATIKIEDFDGQGAAGNNIFKRALIKVKGVNEKTGKTIISFEVSHKEGHPNASEAERRCLREAKKKLVKELGQKIDAYLAK